jgi:hypothetical protein
MLERFGLGLGFAKQHASPPLNRSPTLFDSGDHIQSCSNQLLRANGGNQIKLQASARPKTDHDCLHLDC